jgi:hypothetical protein
LFGHEKKQFSQHGARLFASAAVFLCPTGALRGAGETVGAAKKFRCGVEEDRMKTMTGTMYFNPLEGGIWAFEDADGTRYQLDGVGADARGEGKRITVVGELAEDTMGIGMVYPIFKVESYTVENIVRRKKENPA